MVYINETELTLYDLDTLDSILNRIASNLNTINKFLYFPDGIPTLNDFKTKDSIKVENLFKSIKKHNTNFSDLYGNILNKLEQQKLSVDEVVKIYIVYNTTIGEAFKKLDQEYKESYLTHIITEINKIVIIPTNIIDILLNNFLSIETEYSNIILNNNKKVIETDNYFKQFKKINGIPYTKFELKIINFEMDLGISDFSLLELFNNIQLTEFVPFVSSFNFYKLRKEFRPYLEWNKSNNNIIIKVLQKEIPQDKESDYTDIIIDLIDNKIKAILEYNILNNIPKIQLIDRFISIFNNRPITIDIDNIKEKSINGIFYFPNQRVNRYVLSDLIMNDQDFTKFMCIDETIIAQKLTIYIHFYTEDIGNIKLYITEKIVTKKDMSIKDKPEFFIENSYYVRVKIKEAKDLKSIEKFQDILSRLFVKYNQQYDSIIEFYTQFINIEEIVQPIQILSNIPQKKKKIALIDIVPELYVTNYTKFCGQPPVIINDEDEEKEIKKGRTVLQFPKDDKEGSIPRKYICEYKKFSYPGLRLNTLSNSDKFKYLPCCVETSQTEKPFYRNYYYGEEIPATVTEQHIISSDRFVNNKQNGFLPNNILKFFETIEQDKDYEYYRQGVLKTKNTFISCVLSSLKLLTDDTEDFIQTIRRDLATRSLASACKQEMYDYKIEDILLKIQNLEAYFNPDFFIHLLEVKYKCNIFLFKRDVKNPDGVLVIPRHIKGYFKTRNTVNKCIFIYEHHGGDSDNVKYPQCELIFRWNKKGKKDELEYSFDYNSSIIQRALNIFGDFNKFYILNREIRYIDFDENINPVSQVIDFYGKTRMINVQTESNIMISIFTSPMQPFAVNEEIEFKVYKVSEDIAEQFILNLCINNKKINNNILSGTIGNITISIPLINSSIDDYGNHKSSIDEYNKYKKISRYIIQYFYWIYSRYLHTNKITVLNNFEGFKSDNIIIDDKFDYTYISKNFSIESNIFRNNKLILKSEETFRRLSYLLSIELIRNPDKILSFKDRLIIENYFMEVSDFDMYSTQIIMRGTDSINKFILSMLQNNIQYKLYNNILRESLSPYFFKNLHIDNKVYLAQNTLSIKKAIEIYKIWTNHNYNILFNPKDSEDKYSFIFYSYTNNKTIKSYLIEGEKQLKIIRIIGFKNFSEYEDTGGTIRTTSHSFYTVLLPL